MRLVHQPFATSRERRGWQIRNFGSGAEGKQFYRKAAADGERESSRTTGAHPVGESNLDYRKFMGLSRVYACVYVRACVRIHAALSSERQAVNERVTALSL